MDKKTTLRGNGGPHMAGTSAGPCVDSVLCGISRLPNT